MKTLRRFSTPSRWPTSMVVGALLLLVLSAAAVSLCCGAVLVPLGDVVSALLGRLQGTVSTQIVLLARLPRTCGCLIAGAALAVSGAVIQGVLSNPLAAPNIIGVNSGAGLMVALCSAGAPSMVTVLPLAAFLGALAGMMLVLAIAERTGASRITLVLAGVAVSNIFSAGIDAVISFAPDALNGYSDFRMGGLANLSMARVLPAVWVVLAALALILLLSSELDVLMLGMEAAQSLGLSAKALQLILLALAAALAGAAVSFCGILGFVGIIVPHIMRRLVGEESLRLTLSCALGGAAFLMLCDLLARTLFVPHELPVGVVLSLIGGPFFVWLLLSQRKGRIHD